MGRNVWTPDGVRLPTEQLREAVGGGTPGPFQVLSFDLRWDTPDIDTGAALYTPAIGDRILGGWVEIPEGFDVSPYISVGTAGEFALEEASISLTLGQGMDEILPVGDTAHSLGGRITSPNYWVVSRSLTDSPLLVKLVNGPNTTGQCRLFLFTAPAAGIEGAGSLVGPKGPQGDPGPGGSVDTSGLLPSASPFTTTTMDDPVTSEPGMTVVVVPADVTVLAVAIEGDEFPRFILSADPSNFLFGFGNGSADPINANINVSVYDDTHSRINIFGLGRGVYLAGGDVTFDDYGANEYGPVLRSPDNVPRRLTVTNDGLVNSFNLATETASEPVALASTVENKVDLPESPPSYVVNAAAPVAGFTLPAALGAFGGVLLSDALAAIATLQTRVDLLEGLIRGAVERDAAIAIAEIP